MFSKNVSLVALYNNSGWIKEFINQSIIKFISDWVLNMSGNSIEIPYMHGEVTCIAFVAIIQ
jgi:hypothetical protein